MFHFAEPVWRFRATASAPVSCAPVRAPKRRNLTAPPSTGPLLCSVKLPRFVTDDLRFGRIMLRTVTFLATPGLGVTKAR